MKEPDQEVAPAAVTTKSNFWLFTIAFFIVKLAICVLVVRFLCRNSDVSIGVQFVIAFVASFLLGILIDIIWRLSKNR